MWNAKGFSVLNTTKKTEAVKLHNDTAGPKNIENKTHYINLIMPYMRFLQRIELNLKHGSIVLHTKSLTLISLYSSQDNVANKTFVLHKRKKSYIFIGLGQWQNILLFIYWTTPLKIIFVNADTEKINTLLAVLQQWHQ